MRRSQWSNGSQQNKLSAEIKQTVWKSKCAAVSAGAIVGSAWSDLGLSEDSFRVDSFGDLACQAATYGTQEPFMPPLLPLAR
jgi:hypothetical protein